MQNLHKILKRIESYKKNMIQLLIELTAIPALAPENGGDGEFEKANFLKRKLMDFGFQNINIINAPDKRVSSGIRPNIISTIKGINQSYKIWICTHMDVVPPGQNNLWEKNPYEAYYKNKKIYGLGTEDNQQDLVASIFAAKAFIDEKIIPYNTIQLAFLADEETGSSKGIYYILENHLKFFNKSDWFIVPDYGNKDGSVITISEKSSLWLTIKTYGKQCHASNPSSGINALKAASYLIVALDKLYKIFNKFDPIYNPGISTFEPTKKNTNIENINTIPGEDLFYFDCRILPCYSLDKVYAEIFKIKENIQNKFNVKIKLSTIQKKQAALPTNKNSSIVKNLQKIIKDTYNICPISIGIGGGTIASPIRQFGYPAVVVWSKMDNTGHKPNEYCHIDNIINNAKIFAKLFYKKYLL